MHLFFTGDAGVCVGVGKLGGHVGSRDLGGKVGQHIRHEYCDLCFEQLPLRLSHLECCAVNLETNEKNNVCHRTVLLRSLVTIDA